MRKSQAIDLLGGTIAATAGAVGVTYQAVKQWPEELPARIADRVLGVALRLGIEIPASVVQAPKPNQPPAPAHQAQAAINSETEQGAAHA